MAHVSPINDDDISLYTRAILDTHTNTYRCHQLTALVNEVTLNLLGGETCDCISNVQSLTELTTRPLGWGLFFYWLCSAIKIRTNHKSRGLGVVPDGQHDLPAGTEQRPDRLLVTGVAHVATVDRDDAVTHAQAPGAVG